MMLHEEFVRVVAAVNRVNEARNTVARLELYLPPEHQAKVREAYNLIAKAEGIVESICSQVPTYKEGARP